MPWMELGEARQHTLLWQREVNSAFGPKQRKTVADPDRGSCNRQALRHSRGKNPRSDSKPRMALCRRWAYKSLREGELLSFHQPTACLDMQGWHERAAAGRVVVFNEELDDGRLEWRAATCTSIEATKWPMSEICYDRDHSLTGPLQGGMPGASYRVCELWSRRCLSGASRRKRLEEVPSERDHAFQFPVCSKSQSWQRERRRVMRCAAACAPSLWLRDRAASIPLSFVTASGSLTLVHSCRHLSLHRRSGARLAQ